jgi:hypothetical protein
MFIMDLPNRVVLLILLKGNKFSMKPWQYSNMRNAQKKLAGQ